MRKSFKQLLCAASSAGSYTFPAANAIVGDVDIYSLSLKELLELNVSTGSLFEYSGGEQPVGIAIISREKIEISNAKNIANYVYEGINTEIDQWELGDTERIEVVRPWFGYLCYGSHCWCYQLYYESNQK